MESIVSSQAKSTSQRSINDGRGGKGHGTANTYSRKIVLYGRPASGKTCLLAALAMAREPHPEGHSCIWVCDSQTIPMPQGSRESWNVNDPAVARFLGKEWLQRAIEAISNGGVPRANPNDATPFRLLFDVTQTSGRIQRLEMVDYSGELVDPNLSDDVLAKKLLVHLEEADGILVLAEAPRPGEKYHELYRELQVLQQALMLVNNKRRQVKADPLPIAMLLNKWDRFSKMDEFDAEAARIEVDEFINQKPVVPQKALYSVLQSVGGELNGIAFSEVFPVSAFGKTRKELKEVNGSQREVELPGELSPLPSFGLEDPLVWVCQRSDQLELHELRSRAARLAPWKLWQVPNKTAVRVSQDAELIRKRLPPHLPEAKSLAEVSANAMQAFRSQCIALTATCCLIIASCIQGAYLAHDSSAFAQAHRLRREIAAGADPIPHLPELESSATFLAGYSKPSWYRMASQWLVATPDVAKQHHEQLRTSIEQAAHLLAVADEYETRYDSLVTAAKGSPDPEAVQGFVDQLLSLPIPEDPRLADVTGGLREKAANEIRQRKTELETQIGTDKLSAAYHGEMRECRLPEAIAKLNSGRSQFPQVAASLEDHFKNQWVTVLHSKVVEHARADRWESADSLLGRVRNDSGVANIVGHSELSGRVNQELASIVGWRADRAYMKWRVSPELVSAQNEVLQFGKDSHKKAVNDWLAYRKYLSTTHQWQLKITGFATSNTGGVFGNTSYRLSASMNGQVIARTTFSASKGSVDYSLDVTSNEISAKPNDEVSLVFNAATTNWVTSNITFQGDLRGSAQRMTSEATVKIATVASYPDPTITVRLEPIGFNPLTEPKLPVAQDPNIR